MNRKMIVVCVLVACVLFGTGFAVGASDSTPGSNGDPLVSKSYVDDQVATIKKESNYKLITLSKGKKLVCGTGTQIIVISGSAKASSKLVDVTTGKSVKKNKKVSNNHNVITTSKNGGIKASKSSKVLVTGSYSIK